MQKKNDQIKNRKLNGSGLGPAVRRPTIAQVKQAVADYYGITVEQLIGRSRELQFLHPREVAIFICLKYVNKNYSAIARQFGNRDHTTIINSIYRIKSLRQQNKTLHLDIINLVNIIMSGEKQKQPKRRGGPAFPANMATKEDIKRLEDKVDQLTKIIKSWDHVAPGIDK